MLNEKYHYVLETIKCRLLKGKYTPCHCFQLLWIWHASVWNAGVPIGKHDR